jgi:two-component system LytT family response regulator
MDKNYSCLVVEDDPSFSFILQRIIDKIPNLECVGICDNTNEAAIMLQRKKPDILLLDINIDGIDGPEIVEMSDVKPMVIVISSHNSSIMADYDIAYDHFIQKPLVKTEIITDALLDCISKLQ